MIVTGAPAGPFVIIGSIVMWIGAAAAVSVNGSMERRTIV